MKRKGISLITLIITIIVVIILSTAIILNIKDDNVIDNARKAQIGQTLDTFKTELTMEISDKFFEDNSVKISNIDSRDEDGWRITDLVPSISGTEYENELIVINGNLKLKKDSSFPEEKQKVIIEFLGPIEEDTESDDNDDENEEIIPGQNTYQITYDLNGGNGTFNAQTKKEGEALKISSTVPIRVGYTFNNWKATKGTLYEPGAIYEKDESVVLIAQWTINKYTLTFDANGGSCSTTSISENYGTEITLPIPIREGYTFNGWYTSTSGGSKVTYTTMPSKSQTLYAQWTVNKYTLTFNANGGSCSTTSISENYGTKITLPIPTREGYTFTGWYTAATDGDKVTYTTMPLKSQTLYAKWTPIIYTVTYNLDGGIVTNPTEYTVETETITLAQPTKEGYVFIGWTGSNGTTAQKIVTITKGSMGNKSYTANWNKVITPVITENNASIYIGAIVEYTDYPQYANETTKTVWRIFNVTDSGVIQLIANDYVDLTYKGTNPATNIVVDGYSVKSSAVNERAILISYLTTQSNWSEYAVSGKTTAVGAATILEFCSSYKLKYPEKYLETNGNDIDGYRLSFKENGEYDSWTTTKTIGTSDDLYIKTGTSYGSNTIYGAWLGTPYAGDVQHMMYLKYEGKVDYQTPSNRNYGVRPLVSLTSNAQIVEIDGVLKVQ